MTIQDSGTITCLQPRKMYASVCQEGFKMCILNTVGELSAFYIICRGLPILLQITSQLPATEP